MDQNVAYFKVSTSLNPTSVVLTPGMTLEAFVDEASLAGFNDSNRYHVDGRGITLNRNDVIQPGWVVISTKNRQNG